MADTLAHEADLAKKTKTVEPVKPAVRDSLRPSAWQHNNAQEFIDWASRVTDGFRNVTPALFESIKAAHAALSPSERMRATQSAAGTNELARLLAAPDYASYTSGR
jgi:hypothetical protein